MEFAAFGTVLSNLLLEIWKVKRDKKNEELDLRRDIAFIESELPTMAARILQREMELMSTTWEDHVIQKARRWAQDTEDCIVRFMYLNRRVTHGQFAADVKVLRERLSNITDEISILPQGTKSSKEPEYSGFHGGLVGVDVQGLQGLLEPISAPEGKLKIIAIVGFGGSGKTRLANEARQALTQQFPKQIFVRVADRTVDEVLKEVAEMASRSTSATCVKHFDNKHVVSGVPDASFNKHAVGGANASVGADASISVISEMLKSCLQKQRYLIVFDDVRKKKDWVKEWEALEKVFLDSDVGSRIIVTTTSESVAARCSSPEGHGHVYKMSTLNFEDSEKLFLDALNKGNSDTLKKDFKPLVKRCDGLPIALIGSANSLKDKSTLDPQKCRQAIRKLCAPEDSNSGASVRMQWVLMNKYNGLFKKTGDPPKASYDARACLLYFHMFQFGTPIKRKFLIRRWLAENLVQKDQYQSTDLEAASDHWETLVDGNIIRPIQVSNSATTVKSCRLPGTMHQFVAGKSKSRDFITFLCHENGELPPEPQYVRRLSLRDGTATSEACVEKVPVYLLRTLAVSGQACEVVMDFSKYWRLTVLDLKEWEYKGNKLKGILLGICKLVMLKYLGLPSSIGSVPKEIHDLKDLETLDVEGADIVDVSGYVITHTKLEHLLGKFRLYVNGSYTNWIPKDSKLETFSGLVTSKKTVLPKLIKYMTKLKKIKMWCDSDAEAKELEEVSTAIQGFILRGDTELGDHSLSIDVTGCEVQFLDSLEARGHLTKLKLHGRLEKVPEFITQAIEIVNTSTNTTRKSPLELMSLCLSLTTLCGSLSLLFPFQLQPDATLLPSLRYLKLVEKDLGPLHIGRSHFPMLVSICLVGNDKINSVTIEAGALKNLVSLHVICQALDGLAGIQIRELIKLKEIALHSQVSETTKGAWKVAARDHPNKPQVLFIEAYTKL